MKNILAIDDSKLNLQLLSHIVKNNFTEYAIELATNGKMGIEKAGICNPELILLDIMMPGLNGFEVCKQLKAETKTKHIPIIMISALGRMASERIKGLAAGADAFVSKPFNKGELIAQINVALRIRKAEDELKRRNRKLEEYQKKLKKLNTEITLIEESQRRRIAENLHDSLGQTLSLAYINLSTAEDNSNLLSIKNTINETSELLKRAITESRKLTYDLSPPILYELGLIPAIKWKLEQFEKENKTETILEERSVNIQFPKEINIFLYRIFCELMTNISKHAVATKVTIKVYTDKENYFIEVQDNGVGFNKKQIGNTNNTGGFGLLSIAERIDGLNGTLKINSEPQNGTFIKIIVPIKTNI